MTAKLIANVQQKASKYRKKEHQKTKAEKYSS